MNHYSDLPKDNYENIISIGASIEDENTFDDQYRVDEKNHLEVKLTKEQQERLRLAKESGLKTPFGEGKVIIEEPVHKENWFDVIVRRNEELLEQKIEQEICGTNLDSIDHQINSNDNDMLGPNLGAILGSRDNKAYEDVYKSEIGSDNYHKDDMGVATFSGDSFIYKFKHPEYNDKEDEINNDTDTTSEQVPITHNSQSSSLINDTQELSKKLRIDSVFEKEELPNQDTLPNIADNTDSFLSNSVTKALDDPYHVAKRPVNHDNKEDYTTYHDDFANDEASHAFKAQENYIYEATKATQAHKKLVDQEALNRLYDGQLQIFSEPRNVSRRIIPDKPCFVLDKNSMPLMPLSSNEAQSLVDAQLGQMLEKDLLMLKLGICDQLPNIEQTYNILEHCFALPKPPHKLWLAVEVDNHIVFKYYLDNHMVYQELIAIPNEVINFAHLAKEQFGIFETVEPLAKSDNKILSLANSDSHNLDESDGFVNIAIINNNDSATMLDSYQQNIEQTCNLSEEILIINKDHEPIDSYYKDLYDSFAFTIAQKVTRLRKVLPITDVQIGDLKFDFTKMLR